MAAVDYFLKIDGIPGESEDAKHKDSIQIQSWSWGVTQTGDHATGSGGGAGKAKFQDFHFTMEVNKATPKLMLACASGEHIKKAVLTARKAGKEQQEYLKITFTDLLISSYQTGAQGVVPAESISLNFTKIEFEYKPQNAKGGLDAAITTGWDLKKNTKV